MTLRAIRGKAKDKHDRGALDRETIKKKMDGFGVDTTEMLERRKRDRSVFRGFLKALPGGSDDEMEKMDTDGLTPGKLKRQKKEKSVNFKREVSRARSHTRPREPSQVGLKDEDAFDVVKKMDKRGGRIEWRGRPDEYWKEAQWYSQQEINVMNRSRIKLALQ
jgi:hypothetical protein